MTDAYAHGYSQAEQTRLDRQANILVPFIHAHSTFAPGSRILEAGCGTGAQTLELARRNPATRFVSVDRSPQSLAGAQARIQASGLSNVEFQAADINQLPFEEGEFDGVFLCFVLEHLARPREALREIGRVLKPGARVHAFEGDHGSVLACPDNPAIARLVSAVAAYQRLQGGDACFGRRLCPVLREAGFQDVMVEPCVAYADASRPAWVEGFTQHTFIDMMRIQRDAVLERALLNAADWDAGIHALERTMAEDGSFSYSFYRATARLSSSASG